MKYIYKKYNKLLLDNNYNRFFLFKNMKFDIVKRFLIDKYNEYFTSKKYFNKKNNTIITLADEYKSSGIFIYNLTIFNKVIHDEYYTIVEKIIKQKTIESRYRLMDEMIK